VSQPDALKAVRHIREKISREHENDPRRLVDYYMSLQMRHKDRLVEDPSQQVDAADRPPAGR